MDFESFRENCIYARWGFDDHVYPNWQLTCRHKNNKPKGCSWGECKLNDCPVLEKKVSSFVMRKQANGKIILKSKDGKITKVR